MRESKKENKKAGESERESKREETEVHIMRREVVRDGQVERKKAEIQWESKSNVERKQEKERGGERREGEKE